MKTIRYFLLTLFVLAPGFASAQVSADSLLLVIDGTEYPAIAPNWVRQLEEGEVFGPHPLVAVVPSIACEPIPGTDPVEYQALVENPEEVEGNIAVIGRGACPFVLKVEAASAAGAVGIVLWNETQAGGDDAFPAYGGAPTELTNIPAAFVSYNTGLVALEAAEFGVEATFVQTFTGEPFPPPPPATTVGTHNTTVVEFDVYEYGFLGGYADFTGTGFTFDGSNGLYVSSVLVGIDNNVVGDTYAGGNLEWVSQSEVTSIAAPFPAPYDDFNTGYITSFSNDGLGVLVTERSYSRTNDPFVVVELEIENTSGSDLTGVYAGIHADWDTGTTTSIDDEGGVNEDLNLVYVYDPAEPFPYFGVAALGVNDLSGYTTTAIDGTTEEGLFEALSTPIDTAAVAQERAAVTGVGPYDIPAGTAVVVTFAYVGGADEDALFANAQAAQELIEVAVEETTPEGTFVLESAYPNPFAQRTVIGFDLPTAQDVRLTVYDVLGREVATLVDGVRQAGPQTVEFDAASLPSGMYIYRLEAGSTQLTQRVTLVR